MDWHEQDFLGKHFLGYIGFDAKTLKSKEPEDLERIAQVIEALNSDNHRLFFPFFLDVQTRGADGRYEAHFQDTIGEGVVVFGVRDEKIFGTRNYSRFDKPNCREQGANKQHAFNGRFLVKPSGIIDMCGDLDLPGIAQGLVWELTHKPDGCGLACFGELDSQYCDPREPVRVIEP